MDDRKKYNLRPRKKKPINNGGNKKKKKKPTKRKKPKQNIPKKRKQDYELLASKEMEDELKDSKDLGDNDKQDGPPLKKRKLTMDIQKRKARQLVNNVIEQTKNELLAIAREELEKQKEENDEKNREELEEKLEEEYALNEQDFLDEEAITDAAYEAAEIIEKLKRDLWKRELTEDEIEKYEPIVREIEDQKLSYSKILRSNLTRDEKKDALESFMIYPWYSHACKSVSKMMKKRVDVDQERLKRYEELEKRLELVNIRKISLKDKIMDLDIDEPRKAIIYEKYQYYMTLDITSSDYSKLTEWFTWVLKMPWNVSKPIPIDSNNRKERCDYLVNVSTTLDKCAHGLKEAKEEVLLYACDSITKSLRNQPKNGEFSYVLALEGPPGVGKTLLLKNLSKALQLPLEIIPLGGCQDSAYLDGHGYTYEGSKPGRIVEAVKNMKCNNGIIYFDELDKLSESTKGQEVSSLLLHILDPVLNTHFQDKYFSDLHIDLSKILFVISINDRKKIPEALRHRIKIVKIQKPETQDRVTICENYFFPDFLQNFGLENDVAIDKDTIRYIINKTAKEDGVRNLKRNSYAIASRINYLKETCNTANEELNISFKIKDFKLPLTLKPKHVDIFLKDVKDDFPTHLYS